MRLNWLFHQHDFAIQRRHARIVSLVILPRTVRVLGLKSEVCRPQLRVPRAQLLLPRRISDAQFIQIALQFVGE